mmetsp:Transcript_16535/g.34928  ORF Transcript_16535/g.34928 Transcript_16535/m.34928 type:complete len:216 (+) Transcript_16535:82-729(+)
MVIMGPTVPVLAGPPSAFALRMRPWLITAFVLLLPVAAARFAVPDFIGGLFLILTASIGWYAVKGGMDMQWLLCLAVVFFLNALFDAFILMARVVRTEKPMIGPKAPVPINIMWCLVFCGPVVEMVAACLCWGVYREHLLSLLQSEGMGDGDAIRSARGAALGSAQGEEGYGAVQPSGSSANAPRGSVAASGGSRSSTAVLGYEAFQGRGHRIHD